MVFTHRTFRRSVGVAAAVLGASVIVGCSSPNEYSPSAQPTQLSAYAASQKYPSNIQASNDPKLTATVSGDNKQLTLHNYGDGTLQNFNLWINQAYVLHVDQVPAGGYRVFNLSDFYNSSGTNDLAPNNIQTVQVEPNGGQKLMTVQGPQQM